MIVTVSFCVEICAVLFAIIEGIWAVKLIHQTPQVLGVQSNTVDLCNCCKGAMWLCALFNNSLVTQADSGGVDRVISGVYASICTSVSQFVVLYFLHDISKTDAARITRLETYMVHRESWKHIYFGSEGIGLRSHGKKQVYVGLQKECNIDISCWVSLHHVHVADTADHQYFCALSILQSASSDVGHSASSS